MDELTASVNSVVMFDDDYLNNSNYSTKNIASNVHPRLDAFKKKSNFFTNQEERRKKLLIEQKQKRTNLADSNRPISNVASTNKPTKRYYPSPFNNKLMFSEWLEQIEQDDFEKNWIMCICPVGKRCLVVASEGITSVYNKGGKLIARHSSKLPGGSRDSKIDETILDCIYSDILRTYFVLGFELRKRVEKKQKRADNTDIGINNDMTLTRKVHFINSKKNQENLLQWKLKNHPMTDSETEFRFFWLNCKLDETPELSTTSYENPYKFRNIPRLNECKPFLIQQMFEKPYDFEIDGVLFYHKEAHYHHGHTPLSLWLKPYMIPDILMIQLPQWITQTAPSDYKNEIIKTDLEAKNSIRKQSDKMFLDRESILNRSKLEIDSDNFIETRSSLDVNNET